MKKFALAVISVILVVSLTVPAFAWTPSGQPENALERLVLIVKQNAKTIAGLILLFRIPLATKPVFIPDIPKRIPAKSDGSTAVSNDFELLEAVELTATEEVKAEDIAAGAELQFELAGVAGKDVAVKQLQADGTWADIKSTVDGDVVSIIVTSLNAVAFYVNGATYAKLDSLYNVGAFTQLAPAL